MEERKREWIHKPIFNGVPVCRITTYLQSCLESFRKEHREFDEFLIELNKLLKNEDNPNYDNIKKFIDGNSEPNWISPRDTLFDVLIKLFNLCLSPKQAYEYIKECSLLYNQLKELKYKIYGKVVLSNMVDRYDNKHRDFLNFIVEPFKIIDNPEYHHWFEIVVSTKIVEDHYNDISTHVHKFNLRTHSEKLEDTLLLFDDHQNKDYKRKIFNDAIKEIEKKRIIKETSREDKFGWIVHNYITNINN